MHKQIGKIGAIRRELEGKACPFCGGHTYQLVLRGNMPPEMVDSLPVVLSASVLAGSTKTLVEYSGCRKPFSSPQHRRKTRCTCSLPQSNI